MSRLRRIAPLLVIAACSASVAPSDPPTTPGTPDPAAAPTSTAAAAASTTTLAATTTSVVPRATTIAGLFALGRPIVLAHAGGEDQFPHSTPYAYGESVKAGVDMLDFDVQLSKDGVLVVQHDDTVDRTTNGHGNVSDMTYAELARLDNAYWFTPACTCTGQPESAYILRGMRTGAVEPPAGFTAEDFVIPRFGDIVRRYPDIPLNIEIKGSGEPALAAAETLAHELIELGRTDAAVVTSFDDAIVDAFRAIAPEVEVTPGLNASAAWVLGRTPLPEGLRILQLPPTFQDTPVITEQLIVDSHAAGYVIWVWLNDRSLETPANYRRNLDAGLDGLNINFPADGVEAVRQFST